MFYIIYLKTSGLHLVLSTPAEEVEQEKRRRIFVTERDKHT
jgi:hypothetical protein